MRPTWAIAVAVMLAVTGGCGKGDKAKPDKQPVSDEDKPLPPEDPHCADKIPPFSDWMKALVADGKVTMVATGVELANAGGMQPSQIARGAPVVTVKPAEVGIDGTLLLDPSKAKPADLGKQVAAAITAKQGAEVVYVIDSKVPWAQVAALLSAAQVGKHARVQLVFAAGGTPAADPPPKSAVDAELDALAHPDPAKPAATLTAGTDATHAIATKVFADCAAVTQKLFPAIDKLGPGEFDVAVAVGMPEEIQNCGCRVDFPSVQRLMWAWWGRDLGPALAATKVEIAATPKDGTPVTAKPDAPWSEAADLVLAAAEQGKPIAPK